jgi:hypothetical protein
VRSGAKTEVVPDVEDIVEDVEIDADVLAVVPFEASPHATTLTQTAVAKAREITFFIKIYPFKYLFL